MNRKKKLMLLAAFALMAVGCVKDVEKLEVKSKRVNSTFGEIIRVVEIDSCEYILTHVYGGNHIIHKQNCRFCIVRAEAAK